ncbi:DUF397 domain-containing protein [Streptomyces sp. ISL-100]|nr:DUF397 domain-containing protein [Streptomyces sp. ISL-100]
MDLSQARWRKSSYSGGANDCVELADLGVHVAVRDSKALERGPLILGRSAVAMLVAAVACGEPG